MHINLMQTSSSFCFKNQNHIHFIKILCFICSFVSEHIETLEEIDVEYKELALKSGIEKWGRVPALGCEPTFISDLADAVIESLPYVGAMAVSNLEARQVLYHHLQGNKA